MQQLRQVLYNHLDLFAKLQGEPCLKVINLLAKVIETKIKERSFQALKFFFSRKSETGFRLFVRLRDELK